jgi:hypothetical protein
VVWLVCAAATIAIAPAQTPAVYTETVLHNFPTDSPKGAYPYGGVIRDEAGNLYGTTTYGGIYTAGAVYQVGPVNDQNGSLSRLYPDLDPLRYAKPLQDSVEKTGTAVMDDMRPEVVGLACLRRQTGE